MKFKMTILGCLIGIVVLLFAHEYGMAQVKINDTNLPIGIVDVRRALRECKATAKYSGKIPLMKASPPPMTGPSMVPIPEVMPIRAMPRARCSRVVVSAIYAVAEGLIAEARPA